MQLSTLIDTYGLHRRIAPNSLYQMDRSGRLFEQYLQRPADTTDFVAATVSAWVRWMQAGEWAAATVAGHRARLLILWRWAHGRGWAGPLGEVRAAPRPEPMPEAWTLDEVRQLLGAVDQVTVTVRGRWMPAYLRALVLAAYESGLRRGDLWSLDRDSIYPDGTIQIRQHKTGRVHVPRLTVRTAELVLAEPGQHPLAWPGNPREFYTVWGRVLAVACVRPGALHRLRKTGATYVAVSDGLDAAREFLGHRTPEMVFHYVDRRIASPPPRLPPAVA